MLPKRSDESGLLRRAGGDDTAVAVEALRVGAEAGKQVGAGKHEDEKLSIFWRVFGGTLLSIVALVVITLFNNVMSTISELRSEINKLNEHRAELVKKDEFNTRMTSAWDRLQTFQSQNNTQNAALTSQRTELDGFKERLTRQAAEIDAARKDTGLVLDGLKKETAAAVDGLKKEVATVELLKERLAAVEAVRKDLAAVEGLKEKVNALSADAKNHREDYQKLRQDVDKNQAADQERKARRDEQYKELDKALRDLQAAIQDCQVKLARLEGLAAPKPDARPPAARPAGREKVGPPKPADAEKKAADPDKSGEE